MKCKRKSAEFDKEGSTRSYIRLTKVFQEFPIFSINKRTDWKAILLFILSLEYEPSYNSSMNGTEMKCSDQDVLSSSAPLTTRRYIFRQVEFFNCLQYLFIPKDEYGFRYMHEYGINGVNVVIVWDDFFNSQTDWVRLLVQINGFVQFKMTYCMGIQSLWQFA